MDRLADALGSATLRVTTRQGLQLHGIRKHDLREAIATISAQLGSTLGACGDINRNVMAPGALYRPPLRRGARGGGGDRRFAHPAHGCLL